MRFTQCHASPLCSPSRFMLLTGKYNFRNYLQWGVMDRSQKTIGNMLKNAGYKTACFGKWQLSGGDQSVHALGFDKYVLHDALNGTGTNIGSRYKNPHLYVNGNFLPDAQTVNKYGDDIVTDSLFSFMENNKSGPFFIYYPMLLSHAPYSPPPDNSAFATWNPKATPTLKDTIYYKSMVKYMDKKIGQIIEKVKSLGIENNTIIIYAGDNGTPTSIAEIDDENNPGFGGKGTTTEAGTHVPLLVYWPGTIIGGTVNNDLIDFTDFLPTLADMANIQVPDIYRPLDGVSFYRRLLNQSGTPRDWVFCHYEPYTGTGYNPFSGTYRFSRWAQTATYKLYDTSSLNSTRLFYNIKKDAKEKNPIPDESLTAEETVIKQQLLDVINNYVAQGFPIISLNPTISAITDSSAVLKDTIKINGGSTVMVSGAVWSTNPNPVISSSSYTSNGSKIGPFVTTIKGLNGMTVYYVRAYATNKAGTVYSNQKSFKTLWKGPIATPATALDSNKFTAHWNPLAGATSYRLDVSTLSTFASFVPGYHNLGVTSTSKLVTGLKGGTTYYYRVRGANANGTSQNSNVITVITCKVPSLSRGVTNLNCNGSNDGAIVLNVTGGVPPLTYSWTGPGGFTSSSKDISSLKPGTYNVTVKSNGNCPANASANVTEPVTLTASANAGAILCIGGTTNLTVTATGGTENYHHTLSNGNTTVGPQDENEFTVTAGSYTVTVTDDNGCTSFTTITVDDGTNPCFAPEAHFALTEANAITGKLIKANTLKARVFPNPATLDFTLVIESTSNEKVDIIVMDIYGRKVYQTIGSSNATYRVGSKFSRGIYISRIIQGKNIQKLKLIKQ